MRAVWAVITGAVLALYAVSIVRNAAAAPRDISAAARLEVERMRARLEAYELLHGPPDG